MTKILDETEPISIKRATFINGASKYSVIIMNILFTSIMARLLTPDDYGVIAIVTIFTTLFARICDMGFGAAIIQFKDLGREDIHYIFTFTGVLAVVLAVIFGVMGNAIAIFYQNEVYEKLCIILSISIFFNCLNMLPNAVLLRNKMFVQIGIRTVVVNILGYTAAIICATLGGKYFALVLQSVVSSVADFFWNNHTAKLKLKLKINTEPIKRVWSYSFFQFIFGWINYLETNLDNILIGGCMGSTALAYYDKGYKLISYPMNNISGVVTPVLHPLLKDYQDDKKTLFEKYIGVQKVLSIIAMMVTPVFFCASDEIIRIVFGGQWLAAVMVFEILGISTYPRIMMGTTVAMYCSAGNTKMLFVAGSINAVVTCIGIICGIIGGNINFVAVGVSIANWSNMIVTFTILIGNVLKQSLWKYFKAFLGDIGIMMVICVSVMLFSNYFNIDNIFVSLIIKLIFIGIIEIAYLIISGEMAILKRIMNRKG